MTMITIDTNAFGKIELTKTNENFSYAFNGKTHFATSWHDAKGNVWVNQNGAYKMLDFVNDNHGHILHQNPFGWQV